MSCMCGDSCNGYTDPSFTLTLAAPISLSLGLLGSGGSIIALMIGSVEYSEFVTGAQEVSL